MIVITPNQMQQFNTDVRARFAAKLTEQLRFDYPELFQLLPQGLAQRMVAGKIDYAEERYEIHYQNALQATCITAAPLVQPSIYSLKFRQCWMICHCTRTIFLICCLT